MRGFDPGHRGSIRTVTGGHPSRRNPAAQWWPTALVAVAATAVLGLATVPASATADTGGATPGLVVPGGWRTEPIDAAGLGVESATVQVNTTMSYQNAVGVGTGIVLDPGGLVLTNNHVVEGATGINAVNHGNGQTYAVTVLGYDRSDDVAVVQLQGAGGLTTAPLGNSDQVAIGDGVVAVGHAEGQPRLARAAGNVTGLNQSVAAGDDLTGATENLTGMIEFNATLKPGDSGGPLVNSNGQVIGMNTAGSENYRLTSGERGFAIPINQALAIAQQIQSGNASGTVHIGPSGFLGVAVSDAPNASGVLVSQALPGTPAQQAGLDSGDVITSLDGQPVNSATALTQLLDQRHPGDTVTLGWVTAAGQQQSAPIVLAPGPVG